MVDFLLSATVRPLGKPRNSILIWVIRPEHYPPIVPYARHSGPGLDANADFVQSDNGDLLLAYDTPFEATETMQRIMRLLTPPLR